VLMERPLKMLGLHDYRIRLHPEVAVTVTVNVAQSPEEAETQQRLGRAIIPAESGDEEDEQEALGLAESLEDEALEAVIAAEAEEAETGAEAGESEAEEAEKSAD